MGLGSGFTGFTRIPNATHMACLQEAGNVQLWSHGLNRKCALCSERCSGRTGGRRAGHTGLCMLCLTYWHDECMQAVISQNMTGDAPPPAEPDMRECDKSLSSLPAWMRQLLLQPDSRGHSRTAEILSCNTSQTNLRSGFALDALGTCVSCLRRPLPVG